MIPRLCFVLLFSACLFAQDVSQAPVPGKSAVPVRDGKVYKVGYGVTPPRPIKDPDPPYSELGRIMGLNTVSVLQCVVGADGHIHDFAVRRPAGAGLDENAIAVLKDWQFKPATKDGVAVAVEIDLEFKFAMDRYGDFNSVIEKLQRAVRKADITDLRKHAEEGDRRAQLLIGYLYWIGRNPHAYLDTDVQNSLNWLHRAAEQGSGTAAYLLGFIDQDRQPRQFDYARCYKWWTIAQRARIPIEKDALPFIARHIGPNDISAIEDQTRQWLAAHPVVNDLPK
jgi:protein TonB